MAAIGFDAPGGPDVLRIETAPLPRLRPDDVLIRVAYAGVNRPDCLQRAGAYPPPPGASPLVGLEVAGEVVAVGSEAPREMIGQYVAALTPGGGYAEYCAAHTGGKGVNIVLDMVSGDYVARNLKCLAEDGRHVTIALLGGAKADLNMATVMMRRLTLTGSTLRPRSDAFKAALADEIADNAWPLFASGELSPVMDMTFPLTEAAAAHARMEAGAHIGKIVLEVAKGADNG
ncbi:MAG: hypothetical protein CVT77_19380 [Alphaproteobacteria bacterium HGW-Alphaproteobacteria-16]|nr:MAG: hypothetical protein CVT77_19380 [Alphaproteobacteria bacterium HGW-Alphaproteobacteria-16]